MKPTSNINRSAADDAPHIMARDFERAHYRVGGQPATREAWQAAARAQLAKQRITILIDGDVLAAFKAKAGERGYQTLINQTLRESLERESLESTLRQVLREELQAIYP